jgi:O-antigen/teichoic acid export membrane protein
MSCWPSRSFSHYPNGIASGQGEVDADMKAQPSLKKGFLFNALITSQNFIFPIVSFAYLSRILGPEYLGKINFVSSLTTFFAFMAALALPLYGTRAIAKARTDGPTLNRTYSELFLLQAGATLLACLLFGSLFFLIPRLREEPVLFILAGGMLLCTLLSVDWLFSGLEKYGLLFYRDMTLKSASLILLLLFISKVEHYERFLAIGLIIAASSGIWGLIQARTFVHQQWSGLTPKLHLSSLSVMLACNLTSGIYAYLDNVIVGLLTDDHSVGLYSTAIRANRMVVIFLTSLGISIIPRLAYYSQHNMREESHQVATKTVRFMFLIVWPVSALFLAFAPQILTMLSGPEFLPAASVMRLSVPVIAASVFTNYLAFHVLFPIGGEKTVLIATSIAAAISLSLNFLLVPFWGIEGAAITAVLGQLACSVVLFVGAQRRGLLLRPWEGSPLYLGSGAALGICAWIWATYSTPGPKDVLFFLAASVCAYFGFLYLIRDSLAVQIMETAAGKLRKKPKV